MLEEHEVQPLGETRPIPIDVRVVVAGQQSLLEASRQGHFRPDLLARLDGVTVHLPPLRSRREDVPPLFSHFLTELGQGCVPSIEIDFVERLCLHDWPFNVRELLLLVRRLLVLHAGESTWKASYLPARIGDLSGPRTASDRNLSAPSWSVGVCRQGWSGRARGASRAGHRLARLGGQRRPRRDDLGHLATACLPPHGGASRRSRGVAQARASAQEAGQ